MPTPADQLRELLVSPDFLTMPCCFDPLSARLVEQAGFPLTFMSGFAVSAARLALPDTGLISYGEMLDQGRNICAAVGIPVIGDGDTGYGNPANVRRTVQGYAAAGFAGVMIEDQLAPKRCGHTGVKEVVDRAEAVRRIRAACDARDEGADILIMARTDARSTHGLDEALWRIRAFADLGVDILFMEAPRDEAEMSAFCDAVPGPKLANMLEEGITPVSTATSPRGHRLQDRRLPADPAQLRRVRHARGTGGARPGAHAQPSRGLRAPSGKSSVFRSTTACSIGMRTRGLSGSGAKSFVTICSVGMPTLDCDEPAEAASPASSGLDDRTPSVDRWAVPALRLAEFSFSMCPHIPPQSGVHAFGYVSVERGMGQSAARRTCPCFTGFQWM